MSYGIQGLGLQIRDEFIKQKTKQLKRTYRPSPKLDKNENWDRAADICETLNAKPSDYVASIFESRLAKNNGGPFITHLYCKYAQTIYEEYDNNYNVGEEQEHDIFFELESARNQIISATKFRGISVERFLLSDIVPIRPSIKLFLSQNSNLIWSKFCDKAKVELLNDPSLETALKSLNFNTDKIYEYNKYN